MTNFVQMCLLSVPYGASHQADFGLAIIKSQKGYDLDVNHNVIYVHVLIPNPIFTSCML